MNVWFYVVFVVISWGTQHVLDKFALAHTSPQMIQVVSALCYALVAPIMLCYMKATGMSIDWDIRSIGWIAIASTLATLASIAFLTALQRMQTHLVIGLTSCYPLVAFLLCIMFLGESITTLKLIGITAIIAGTVLLGL